MLRYARFVVRHPRAVLVATALVATLVVSRVGDLRLGMNLDDLLPQGHANVAIYRRIKEIFGLEKTAILMARAPEGDVFQPAALRALREVTDALEKMPEALPGSVLSLASRQFKRVRTHGDSVDVEPLMDEPPATVAEAAALRREVLANPLYRGLLASEDGSAVAVVVNFRGDVPNWFIVERLAAHAAPLRAVGLEVISGGPPLLDYHLEQYSARLAWILPLTLLVVAVVHYEAFGTPQAMVLPLVTALVSLVLSLGVMGWLGFVIDPWNAVTPVIILGIAAGHAVQILKRYYEEFEACGDNAEAVVRSLVRVGPVMLTAGGVAAAGFASLATFNVPSIRTFGTMLAAGVVATLFVEFTLIPAVRTLMRPPSRNRPVRRSVVSAAVERLSATVCRWPARTIAFWLLLLPVAAGGIVRVRVNNDVATWFYAGSPARLENDAINARFAGTSNLLLLVRGDGPGALEQPQVLRAVMDLEEFLARHEGIGKVVSYVDLVREMQRMFAPEDHAAGRLPGTHEGVAQYLLLYELGNPAELTGWIDAKRQWALLTAFSRTAEDRWARQLLDDTRRFVAERFVGLPATVEVGAGVLGLEAAINETVVREKMLNIAVVSLVVLVLGSLAMRSVVGGGLILAPLVLAVLVNVGIMGWTGIWLSMATAAIAAMGVSIGADFAIYLLYRIREETVAGRALGDAVAEALRTAGQAVCFVSSAVVAGYLTLVGAGFRTWTQVGTLTALMISVSAAATLTLVPALVLVLRPRFVMRGAHLPRPAERGGGTAADAPPEPRAAQRS